MEKKLGILGGGQLGRMMITPCIDLGVEVYFLDPNPECSVSEFTAHLTVGDFNDYETVLNFGRTVDVITVEIEHVNVEALEKLEKEGKAVNPSSQVLRTIQDKGLQKEFYQNQNIPSPDFRLIKHKASITDFPIVQKMRKGGYDGQGVQILKSATDFDKAFDAPSVLEDLVDLRMEIGVMVARNAQGEVQAFPPVSMDFDPELNLVKYVVCPAQISEELNKKCIQMANSIAHKFELVGIMAVELFVTKSGEVLVNECAPRVHNSGHLTIEGTSISQFEMHIRSVMGFPLPPVSVTKPSVMLNLLGEMGYEGEAELWSETDVLALPEVYLHWYGKKTTRPGRKMAHVTVLRNTVEEAKSIADEIDIDLKVIA
ncbi:5-(carboxyamino)imidazole ribonucleotide synthase [bacterium]|nr:5-(carboxyamino)imidazole ribonucleotide synthase [bacterium]NCQ55856.1 5-(carboxyamino)imidazole ribonucleotide synthase [Candidatus Parcubacteria bacterium]NCS67564.1 5-(carboxyamino)imidazole ribonucleotide synthase [Candidatus Peregrinibacteria bacterium]NCS96271.1 5-(carboxyamino)imidazole ribonucleotide synthase [bacterium]